MCFCSTAHCAAASIWGGTCLAPGPYCHDKTNFPENHFHSSFRGSHNHTPPQAMLRLLTTAALVGVASASLTVHVNDPAHLAEVAANARTWTSGPNVSACAPLNILAAYWLTGTESLLPRSRRPTPRPAATSRSIRPHVSPLPTFHVSLPSLPIAPLTSTRSPAAHTHNPHPPSFTAS